MANPCAPAVSEPNPTYSNVVVFGAIALGSFLNNKGMGWLLQYGIPSIIGTLTFDLPNFCSADPPVVACITADDVKSWFNPLNPTGAAELRTAMYNLIAAFAWYDLCQCAGGAVLTPPSACGAPATVQLDPPALAPAPLPSTCASSNHPSFPYTASPQVQVVFGPAGVALPKNASRVEIDLVATSMGQATTVSIQWKTAGGAQISSITEGVIAVGGAGFSIIEAVPANAAELDITYTWAGTQSAARTTWVAGVYCNGDIPSVPIQSCCAPDPSVQAMLSQIQAQISGLQSMLQIYPPQWFFDLTYTGITGDRALVLKSGTLEVMVHATTIPSSLGRTESFDPIFFDMGFVTLYDAVGAIPLGRLINKEQAFLIGPGTPSQARSLGLVLPPGVVVDVWEAHP